MKYNLCLGLSALALAGCSLALDLDNDQPCSSASDCVYSNGQGSCVDNVCQPPGETQGSDTTGTTSNDATTSDPSSTTNVDPTLEPETSSSTSSSDDDSSSETTDAETTGPTGCTQNTDCATDQRCGPDSTCLDLLSAECDSLQYPDNDDFDRNNVVFVGSIFPSGGSFEDLIQPLVNATQLAFEDFNEQTTLQGDRQVAWVSCDSTAGPLAAVAAATHLVDNVGVPAIIGPGFSESVIDVAQDVTVDADVFIITPTATATSITGLEDNNLVWRTIAPDTFQANGFIDRLVERRAEPEATRLERLLVLVKGDAYGTGLRAGIQDALDTQLPGVTIHYENYEDPASFADFDELTASYGATIASAYGELPATFVNRADHYTDVVLLGTSETQSLMYFALAQWGFAQQAPPDPSPGLPRFIVSHGTVPEMERIIDEIGVIPGTESLVPAKPLIAANFEGISPIVFDENNFAEFNIRYRIRFNDQDALTSAGLSYDAAMATFFAMASVAETETITGTAIAEAFPRLMDARGTPVSFSGATLSFITEARNAIAVGGSVDLRGVSGELTWDDAGDIRTGLFGWGLDDLDKDPAVVDPRLDVRRSYVLDTAPAATGTWVDLP